MYRYRNGVIIKYYWTKWKMGIIFTCTCFFVFCIIPYFLAARWILKCEILSRSARLSSATGPSLESTSRGSSVRRPMEPPSTLESTPARYSCPLKIGVPDPWHFETDWICWLESGSGSCSFLTWLSRCQKKTHKCFPARAISNKPKKLIKTYVVLASWKPQKEKSRIRILNPGIRISEYGPLIKLYGSGTMAKGTIDVLLLRYVLNLKLLLLLFMFYP